GPHRPPYPAWDRVGDRRATDAAVRERAFDRDASVTAKPFVGRTADRHALQRRWRHHDVVDPLAVAVAVASGRRRERAFAVLVHDDRGRDVFVGVGLQIVAGNGQQTVDHARVARITIVGDLGLQ